MNFQIIKKLFFLFLLTITSVYSQIDLSMPVNRMVYQRNKQNTANIYVGGSFSGQLDKIEARLTLLNGAGQPKTPLVQTNWLTIVNTPQKGNFLGTISSQQAGWYRLEVRAIQNNLVVGDINTIKVGIGEVIVLAGQSNVVGDVPIKDKSLYNATDDRVNCINLNDQSLVDPFKYPVVSHLDSYSLIAPTGGSAWCWGLMGDLIAKNWDVPVIFFNAALGNTGIFQWRASANNEYEPGTFDTVSGVPFINLKKTLTYYCSLMGVRAVLWGQGENDNGIFGFADPDVYRSNLQQVIDKSRSITSKDISWVIAKTSLAAITSTTSVVNWNVIQGQELTIALPNYNVFAGPNTDNIQPSYNERDIGGVHFWGQGILDLGYAWFNSLSNPNFLTNSKPHAAIPPQLASMGNCVNNNQVTVALPAGFTNYSWYTDNYNVSNKNQSFIATNSKLLVPYMKDGAGNNFIFSPPINFTPQKVALSTDRAPIMCEGQTVNIFANTFNTNFNWSTGSTEKAIPIKTEGNYNVTVSSKDIYGCTASVSGSYTVKINPLPPSPVIVADGSASICDGSAVRLRPDKEQTLYENIWSNGVNTAAVIINKTGKYSLNYKDKNNCESIPSNNIEVIVNPNPIKPDIVAGGETLFCADKFVSIATSNEAIYEWQLDNKKVDAFTTQFINANLPGKYKSRVFNKFGCPSPFSDEVKVENLPLPESPIITKSGPTAFCAGGDVELTANSSISNIIWSTDTKENYSNDQRIKINTQRENPTNTNTIYFARVTDNKGCVSKPSEKVVVSVRANPSVHKIDGAGTFTLEAKTPIFGLEGTSYNWYYKNEKISSSTKDIKVTQAGNYSVIAKITYNLPNIEKLECLSFSSPVFEYFDRSTLFSVYPTPSYDGLVTMETKNDLNGAQISLFTALGQPIMSQFIDLFNERKVLDLRALPNGEYKLLLTSGTTNIVKSVIISKK
jgi:Carbohydrate esterase, sialic acid-specific acetylesterase